MEQICPLALLVILNFALSLCGNAAFAAPSGEEQARMHFEFEELRRKAWLNDAEAYAQKAIGIFRNSTGDTRTAIAAWTHNLALAVHEQGRYTEAESLYNDALRQIRAFWRGDHAMMSSYLDSLARLYIDLTRYREAETLIRQALALRRSGIGKGSDEAQVADSLNLLGIVLRESGRLDAAEDAHKESLEIRQHLWGPLQNDVAIAMGNLALVYQEQGQYIRAQLQQKKALSIRVKLHGEKDLETAFSYSGMGSLMHDMGRYAEAEDWHLKALMIRMSQLGKSHPKTADSMADLSQVLSARGRFAEAGIRIRHAIQVYEAAYRPDHLQLARTYNTLANILDDHKQFEEAIIWYQKSLSIVERVLGEQHVRVARRLHNLALMQERLEHPDEAEKLYRKAIEISVERLGNEHPDLIISLSNLAMLYDRQMKKPDAERLWRRVEAIQQRHLEPDHVSVGTTLGHRARGMLLRGEFDEALPLVDRAIEILNTSGVSPRRRAVEYGLKADLLWATKDRQAAVDVLSTAMQLAELQRLDASGIEFEQAELYSRSIHYFEKMVDWQIRLGNLSAAFEAAERARSRTLLEQFELRGSSQFAGIPEDESARLQRRLQSAQVRVASYEKQLKLLQTNTEIPLADKVADRVRLVNSHAEALQDVIEVRREIRDAGFAPRMLLAGDYVPASLRETADWATSRDTTVIRYFTTENWSVAFVVQPGRDPAVYELSLNKSEAGTLGVPAGPLGATRIEQLLLKQDEGILETLLHPSEKFTDSRRWNSLYRLLVPDQVRKSIVGQAIRKLTLIPDGPLSYLPFETLVTAASDDPVFLIDHDIAITYCPSATILLRLNDAPIDPPSESRTILTIGNPTPTDPSDTDEPTTRYLYSALGGRFDPLVFAEQESRHVATAFRQAGWTVRIANGPAATETFFRTQADDCNIIHLACHGFVDEQMGNLFGSLAFAPDDESDGLLTLGEIGDLRIPRCRLVVLSACETNYGPLQAGEGVWALARAFLAAGGRSVVASRWAIDDESTATLVTAMLSSLANSTNDTSPASALHSAQRQIRSQDRWKHPYYWAAFSVAGFEDSASVNRK